MGFSTGKGDGKKHALVGGLTSLAAASAVEVRHVLHFAIAGRGVYTLMRKFTF